MGTLVAFVTYLVQFYQPVEDLFRVNNTIQQALSASERIFEVLDVAPDVTEPPRGPSTCRRWQGARWRLDGVTFAYDAGQPGPARHRPARRARGR